MACGPAAALTSTNACACSVSAIQAAMLSLVTDHEWGSGSTAREMGHLPVSASDGSLQKLKNLRNSRKILIHLNNTNPILNESGAEYREVRAAGWEIAEDGWRIDL